MIKKLFEHLITKGKYNTKCIEAEALKEDIAHLNILMKEKDDTFKIQEEVWEEQLIKQTKEIIKLKKLMKNQKINIKTKKEGK